MGTVVPIDYGYCQHHILAMPDWVRATVLWSVTGALLLMLVPLAWIAISMLREQRR